MDSLYSPTLNTQYLVDINMDKITHNIRLETEKNYQELKEIKLEIIDSKYPTIINSVFINMSVQSIAIIDFMNKSDELSNCVVQIYLHRRTHIDKFLNPIILTNDV